MVAPDEKKDDRFLERDSEPQAAFKDLTVPMEVARKVKEPPIKHAHTQKHKTRRMSKLGTAIFKAKLKIGDVDSNSSPNSSDNHNLIIPSLSALHNIPTRKDLDDSPGLKAESPHGRRKSSILSLSFGATNALAQSSFRRQNASPFRRSSYRRTGNDLEANPEPLTDYIQSKN